MKLESEFELDDKYLVLKREDIYDHLSYDEEHTLYALAEHIAEARKKRGKNPTLSGIFINNEWDCYAECLASLKKFVEGK